LRGRVGEGYHDRGGKLVRKLYFDILREFE
jgi:hypothetical protein